MSSSLAEFLLAQQRPQFQTQQALLVIGLQNDFLSPDGKLPVSTETGFVDRIKELVPKFRELAGDVIWIRSEFDAESASNGGLETSEVIVADVDEQPGEDASEPSPSEPAPRGSSSSSVIIASPRSKNSRSKRKKAMNMFKDIGKKKQATAPVVNEELIQEEEELFFSTAKQGPCCIRGSTGADFAPSINDIIQPSDTVVIKSRYSAFNETSLIISLRTKLITELYVCGCMTNVSVYATIADAVRHGFTINIVEDCLGYRTASRHETALALMADGMGAYTVTSAEILEDLDAPPDTATKTGEDDASALGQMLGKLNLEAESEDDPKQSSHDVVIAGLADSLGAVMLSSKHAGSSDATKGTTSTLPAINPYAGDDEDSTALSKTLRSYRSQPDVRKSYVKSRIRVRPKDSPSKQSETTKSPAKPERNSLQSEMTPSTANKKKEPEPKSTGGGEAARTAPPLDSSPTPKSMPSRSDKTSTSTNKPNVTSSVETRQSQSVAPRIKNSKSTPSLKSRSPTRVMTSERPPQIPEVYQPSRVAPGEPKVAPSPVSTPVKQPASKKKLRSLANLPTLGPEDSVGEGDSYIRYNLIPPTMHDEINDDLPLADTIFHALYHEVRWQKMFHAAGEVPRRVAVQGVVGEDGSVPIYRHPSDQAPPLSPFSKHVDIIRKETEQIIGHPLNHVLIQLYRDGKDFISEHSDKTLDIVRGSSIVNASFGAQRTMRLRTKKSGAATTAKEGTSAEVEAETQRVTQRIPMPHNSCFVLGLRSNQIWLHGIQADKRPEAERTAEELAYNSMRISLTFRHIGTFLSKDESRIWGQGAKKKQKKDAADVVNGNVKETEKMIHAFGIENHESDKFNWDDVYGEGFDVLHFRSADADS